MKPIALISFLLLCYHLSFGQSTYKATVYFDTDSDALMKAGEDELSPHLTTPNLTAIRIEGHTDNEGNIEYNRELSQRRANAVKVYLTNFGIASELIEISFFGEEAPLTENQTDTDKSLNRRVEVTFYYVSEIVEEPETVVEKIPAPIVEESTESVVAPVELPIQSMPDSTMIDNTDLYTALAKQVPSYEYIINNKRDTMLQLPSGILLFFDKNVFELPDENYREEVKINITEYLKRSHAVLGNVTTLSNGELLYSAGMFDIRAFANEESIELKTDKEYKILFPTAEKASQARSLKGDYGVKDSLSQDLNWLPASARSFGSLQGEAACRYCNGVTVGSKYKEKKYSIFKRTFKPAKVRILRRGDYYRYRRLHKAEKILKDTDKKLVQSALNCGNYYMFFQAQGLGLVNCDWIWKVPESECTNLLVNVSGQDNMKVFMVFKSRVSIMYSNSWYKDYYGFSRVPKDEEVWMVAVKQLGDGKYEMGMTQANTSGERINIEFKSFDNEETLATALEKING